MPVCKEWCILIRVCAIRFVNVYKNLEMSTKTCEYVQESKNHLQPESSAREGQNNEVELQRLWFRSRWFLLVKDHVILRFVTLCRQSVVWIDAYCCIDHKTESHVV